MKHIYDRIKTCDEKFSGTDSAQRFNHCSSLGSLEGVGPEIKTFLSPEMAKSKASTIWAQSKEQFINQQRHLKYKIYASVHKIFISNSCKATN
jgi:hypothetical protein